MKNLKLSKVIASLLTLTSVLTLNPIGVSAQWKQNSNGWWNTEGSSWSVGWRYIDKEWYYFDNNGYMKTGWILDRGKWYYLYDSGSMAKNTTINDYIINADGVWIQSTQNNSTQNGSSNVEKPTQNSYEELDKLPYEYNTDEAKKNGDVIEIYRIDYNIGKLDKFIVNYKNKKAHAGDMVRITVYGDEGGAMIRDLIIDSEGIKFMEDNTRDEYSVKKDRIITTYRVVDIYRIDTTECMLYYAKTYQGMEKFLYSSAVH